MQQSTNKNPLNWTMIIFFSTLSLIAVVGTTLLASYHLIRWPTVILALCYICATAITITAGYHRLFSHNSYQAHWTVKLFFAIFGAAAYEGSIVEWCSDHRVHHRYTDTEKDPYNIKQGFWYAHMGWIFKIDPSKRNLDNVKDLSADPIIAWQHRNIGKLGILFGFLAPTLIAALWGDALGGFIIAGALRMTLNHHFTWLINSICHYMGKQTYADSTARDHWFAAIFTFGEGYHNFHHKFPLDYRNGVRYFHYDPTKWLIRALEFVGLASNLKRVPQQKIIEYRMRMQKQRLEQSVSTNPLVEKADQLITQLTGLVEPAYNSVIESLKKIEALEKSYIEYKKNKHQGKILQQNRSSIKHARKIARKELRNALNIWSQMLKQGHAIAAA